MKRQEMSRNGRAQSRARRLPDAGWRADTRTPILFIALPLTLLERVLVRATALLLERHFILSGVGYSLLFPVLVGIGQKVPI
jgi:hypothetical protein